MSFNHLFTYLFVIYFTVVPATALEPVTGDTKKKITHKCSARRRKKKGQMCRER